MSSPKPTPVPIEQLRREVPQVLHCLVDFLSHARAFRTVVQGQPALDLLEAAETYVRDQRSHAVALLSELAAGHLLTYVAHPGMRFVSAIPTSLDPLPAAPLPHAMPRRGEVVPAAPSVAPPRPQPFWERNLTPVAQGFARFVRNVFAVVGFVHWLLWLCGGAA